MKTLAVISGGMDSVTLLHRVKAEGKEVEAISFDYGQIHVQELDCAKWQAEQLGIKHRVIDVTFLKDLLPSALTQGEEMPTGHYEDESMKKTVVPFRNTILASIALGVAAGNGFDEITLGVHAGDHAIYPDCRPEFIDALREVARLGDYNPVGVYTPYLNVTKKEIIEEGLKYGVQYEYTWTSYSAGTSPDYTTGSSVERTLAFIDNGIADPLYSADEWEVAKAYALEQRNNKDV